jgi:pimeloyl-ACP methyl ester carboxylesterase
VPTVRANGLDIAYEVVGAGPPLVMLHGATSIGRDDFAAQIPLFSKAFQLILPDARGHGMTAWDAAKGFQHDWLVDDLAGLIDALDLETFHLLGFSMGAMTALQYASRHGERIRTLVSIGITTQREPRLSVARRLMDPARADRDDPAWAVTLGRRHDAGQGAGAWRTLLPAIAADVATQPLMTPRELHAIDAPALIVAGDRDPFVPVDHAWGLARQVRDGRLFVLPDCGHEAMVRRPGLFNEGLTSFYRQTNELAARRAGRGAADAADTAIAAVAADPSGSADADGPTDPAATRGGIR